MVHVGFWSNAPGLLTTLAYLVGAIVGLAFIFQRKGAAAMLTFLGFGGLFLVRAFNWLLRFAPLLFRAADRRYVDPFNPHIPAFPRWNWALAGVGCIADLIAVGAVFCLVAALWTALRERPAA
jgi:hypothetical protein